MDQIAFAVIDGGEYDGDTVRVLVNGVDLATLAGPGGYRGLPWKLATSRHLLGAPEPLYQDGERIYVLACDCNDFGCRPLLARVELAEAVVTWSDFHQAQVGGAPVALGPFRFERGQYEAAWRDLVSGSPILAGGGLPVP